MMYMPTAYGYAGPSKDWCLDIPVRTRAVIFVVSLLLGVVGAVITAVGFTVHMTWVVEFWMRMSGGIAIAVFVGTQYIYARECCYPWRRHEYEMLDTDT